MADSNLATLFPDNAEHRHICGCGDRLRSDHPDCHRRPQQDPAADLHRHQGARRQGQGGQAAAPRVSGQDSDTLFL